jgi:hypothetical protein
MDGYGHGTGVQVTIMNTSLTFDSGQVMQLFVAHLFTIPEPGWIRGRFLTSKLSRLYCEQRLYKLAGRSLLRITSRPGLIL